MKKLFLIMIAALCFVAVGCKKTCQCTQTDTITYDSIEGDVNESEPSVSTANYTAEAKNCSDLNAESNSNVMSMHMTVKVECK